MLWLQSGDRLPTVALVQHALGFEPRAVDGVFGPKTRKAVVAFQRKHPGLLPDSIVGPNTWQKLHPAYRCSIVNVLDLGDPRLAGLEIWLKEYGGDPIKPVFRSNALEYIGRMAALRSEKQGPIGLLRIFSHGNSGAQNLSLGEGGHMLADDPSCVGGRRISLNSKDGKPDACGYLASDGQAMKFDNIDLIKRYLSPLVSRFSPLGSIELHGCEVANKLKGQKFVFALAVSLGVPVTAPTGNSKVTDRKKLLRFESPPSTWFPMAGELKPWAQNGAQRAVPSKLRQLAFNAA